MVLCSFYLLKGCIAVHRGKNSEEVDTSHVMPVNVCSASVVSIAASDNYNGCAVLQSCCNRHVGLVPVPGVL